MDFRLNNYRSLNELTIGILGVGEIGNSCAKLLHGKPRYCYSWSRRNREFLS